MRRRRSGAGSLPGRCWRVGRDVDVLVGVLGVGAFGENGEDEADDGFIAQPVENLEAKAGLDGVWRELYGDGYFGSFVGF